MSMSLLPTFSTQRAWEFLKHPPVTDNSDLQAKLNALATYVDSTWINGDFPHDLWSHFDNLGPRTTNLAEGWHNSLNSKFGMPHPSLRTFLDWLQKCQHEVQCRGIQLASGRPAKTRLAKYVQVDENLMHAKIRYNLDFGFSLFSSTSPEQTSENFRMATMKYLSHVAYLLLGSD